MLDTSRSMIKVMKNRVRRYKPVFIIQLKMNLLPSKKNKESKESGILRSSKTGKEKKKETKRVNHVQTGLKGLQVRE
jgi:hypothetical protein